LEIKPYSREGESKKAEVRQMFDRISPVYDFLNGLLSLGIDRIWRRKALTLIPDSPEGSEVLDVATGTGALAIQGAEMYPQYRFVGSDISEGMLEIGRVRVAKRGLSDRISLEPGDSENLNYESNRFVCVTAAFGVRNFENLDAGLSEMYRVICPGGRIIILEFSRPRIFPFKQLFNFYFRFILPFIGRIISKDARAYSYLYESVQQFPDYERFVGKLAGAGFKNSRFIVLSLGICCIYTGEK